MAVLTYSYRIKDARVGKRLSRLARAVNFVWNYCNQTALYALQRDGRWLSAYDLHPLLAGSSKKLGLHSQTVQGIADEYATRRRQVGRARLRWRGRKSLGWVPFKASGVKVRGHTVRYAGHTLRFWESRPVPAQVRSGSFSQDARGRWYVHFQCEVEVSKPTGTGEVGIAPGLKTLATFSDGTKAQRDNLTRRYEEKLARAQRARKHRQVRRLHAKAAHARKDFNHKLSSQVAKANRLVVVGNLSSTKLVKTRFAKSVLDAGWSQLRSMLRYKAIGHGATYTEVSEAFSTVTCSACLKRTGPSGLSALGVREWACSGCGATHDRDVNAAKLILRLGHQTPIKGISGLQAGEDVNSP